jgi:hypothetical protein
MSGLKEAFDDIAAEISPVDPPVELTMRQGKRINNGRLAAVVGGTTGTVILGVGALLGLPVLLGHGGGPSSAVSNASVNAAPLLLPDYAPLLRPVLLESPTGSTSEYGNAALVDAATLKVFGALTCVPGPNAETPDDQWKPALGYTAMQWNASAGEVVSCDAGGTKYVLGPAVVLSSQVTSATAVPQAHNQWGVDVTLDQAATQALAMMTKNQYASYAAAATTDPNDAALDSIALVLNGDVHSAPLTEAPLTRGQIELEGPQPTGFTSQAEAAAFAARIAARS